MQDQEKSKILPITGHIERKLYLLVACAVLPALLIILYSGFSQRDQALEEANNELANLNTNIANTMMEKTSQSRMLLKTLAAMPEVRSLDMPRLSALFQRLGRDNPGLAVIFLADVSGDILAASLPMKEKVNVADRAAFRDAVRTKDFSAGEYAVGRISEKPVFQFGYPVILDSGALAGVICVAQSLEDYATYLTGLIIQPKSRLILLDRNGLRIVSAGLQPVSPPTGGQAVAENWRIVSETESESGSFEAPRYDGLKTLFHYRKLSLKPGEPPFMYVVTDTPRTVVLASANRKLAMNLFFLLLASLLAMGAARMLGRAFVGRQVEALAESEERYALAMRGTNDGIWDWDLKTDVVFFSPRWKEIIGYGPDEIRNDVEEWKSRVHPEDLADVLRANMRCAEGEAPSFEVEYRLRHKDGSYRWVLGRGASLKNDRGDVVRLAGAHTDITEHKQMRELMIQTEKMVSVGGLAAGMAHEINNPLGGILQSVQVILRRMTEDTKVNRDAAEAAGCSMESIHKFLESRGIAALLQSVRESGARAAKIVANMLEFSRKADSATAPVDLARLLDKALELCANDYDLKKKYDFRKIQILRDYDPGLPQVTCTQSQIEQVVVNILRNAAQALARRTDQTQAPAIVLRTRRSGDFVRIEVEDNGPGMTESERKRIFEPFFTTKPVGEGTGLGLSVSYFIVTENHKGTIEAQSSPGNGARFIIHLPLDPRSSHEEADASVTRGLTHPAGEA
jgi:PAS domain S-box-containing protein